VEFGALLLSGFQFAFKIGFHILFPTLTIGLGAFLVLIEGRAIVPTSYSTNSGPKSSRLLSEWVS